MAKINLGASKENLSNAYTGDSEKTIEDFDAKKSIDDQLSGLDNRTNAKTELQGELASIKTASDFKNFLKETDTEKGYNNHISTYAGNISIKLGKHEYAFKAEDEATRVSIHTAMVEFFRTQVIEKQVSIYKESDDYNDLKTEKQKTALETKKTEIEAEFDDDKFELNADTLKTTFSPTAESGEVAAVKEDKGFFSGLKKGLKQIFSGDKTGMQTIGSRMGGLISIGGMIATFTKKDDENPSALEGFLSKGARYVQTKLGYKDPSLDEYILSEEEEKLALAKKESSTKANPTTDKETVMS